MSDEQRTREFLATQEYMVLAVTLDDGSPWAVPVKIQLQWESAFEWDSLLDTKHSKAIAKRPNIAITIYEKAGDSQFGFYAKATAKLIEEKKPGLGRYQAIITAAWIDDETFVKREVSFE